MGNIQLYRLYIIDVIKKWRMMKLSNSDKSDRSSLRKTNKRVLDKKYIILEKGITD